MESIRDSSFNLHILKRTDDGEGDDDDDDGGDDDPAASSIHLQPFSPPT